MIAKLFSIYRQADGIFTGEKIRVSKIEKISLKDGLAAYEGDADHRSERIDVQTGKKVPYQPPEDHEARSLHARIRIEILERAQARPQREIMLNPANATARAKLEAIEEEIARLRSYLGPRPQ